ncbi:MAG: 30S ribosomal protein S7 [Candidatus Micrarchaeota archaeon]|nr:30S ribosomal protein S7 [Candidatus Micrarchaeota archaeon]
MAEAQAAKRRAAPKKAPAKATTARYNKRLFFGKYSADDIVVSDPSLQAYIMLKPRPYPNIYGRRKHLAYYKAHVDLVERLINKLMRGGTGKKISGRVIRKEGSLQGKKLKVVHILEEAFEIIHRQTGKNPIQLLVDAIQNAAPIEDTTRVRYGGISYNVAVGISSQRRLDVALRNMAVAALMGAFKNKKRLAETLATEITLAANNSPDSYAIKKRIESERIAKRAR